MSPLQNVRVSKCLFIKISKCKNVPVSHMGGLQKFGCQNVREPAWVLGYFGTAQASWPLAVTARRLTVGPLAIKIITLPDLLAAGGYVRPLWAK